MTPLSAAKQKKSNSRPKRHENDRGERLRIFNPDLVPLIRADLEAAYSKPQKAESSIMEFIEQFFDEIHGLREKKHGWNAIYTRLKKYVDCSPRTLQAYYNVLAIKRGIAPESNGKSGPKPKSKS